MFANKLISLLLVGLAVSGCAATSPGARIDGKASKIIAPKGAVEEDITELDDVLSCVGVQVALYGKVKFYVSNDRVSNPFKDTGVPESGSIYLQEAFSTLVNKSQDRIVFAGYNLDSNNEVVNGHIRENQQQRKLRSLDTPEYIIAASISHYEKDAQKANGDIDMKAFLNWFGASNGANASVLGTHLTLKDARSGNLKLTGISSKQLIAIRSSDSSAGMMMGNANVGGVGLNMAMQKREGIGAALAQLMKIGAIEITGKFYEDDFDYRQCLNKNERKKIQDKAPTRKKSRR